MQVKGVRKYQKRIGKVDAKTLLPPMVRSVYKLQIGMARYPRPRPESTYRRTGTLGRRWTTKVESRRNSVTGTVGNNTTYAPFVQSRLFQARMHRGTWQTDQQVLDQNRHYIERQFSLAVDREVR